MKKLVTILMVFVLIFALAACEPAVINDPQVPQSNQPQNNQQNDVPQDVQQDVSQNVQQRDVNQAPAVQNEKPAVYNNNYIGEEKAKQIALGDAGVLENNAQRLKVKFDFDDGRGEYEVDFHVGTTEYDYEIDAVTGVILDKDVDYDDFD